MKKLLQMSSADGTLSDGVFTEAMEALDTVIARKHAEKGMLEGLECTIRMGGMAIKMPTKANPKRGDLETHA
jgi:hypothetical protein